LWLERAESVTFNEGDVLCGGPPALARGGAGGALFFMIKQENIRNKMRLSDNNMMISCEQPITIQMQYFLCVF
jgi:hypothetical protein